MDELKDLLVDELGDLLHAEGQLVEALPEMATAARHPKLKEAFEKHLQQTERHTERLKAVFDLLGEKARGKPCKGMMGLIAEGREKIQEQKEDGLAADLSLIAAAQKIEHYEISGYGTARYLARQIGEREAEKLLSHTLGEEESTDFLLTEISKPILHDVTLSANREATPKAAKAQKA